MTSSRGSERRKFIAKFVDTKRTRLYIHIAPYLFQKNSRTMKSMSVDEKQEAEALMEKQTWTEILRT